jgi:F-type H+-transporting ATPase subunit b
MRRQLGVLTLGFGLLVAGPVLAKQPSGAPDAAPLQVAPPEPNIPQQVAEHGAAEHGEEHVPTIEDFNWYYGLLSEKEGVEPNLLFRPKGMPVPFLGLLFDSLILYWLLYRFFGKGVREGLKKRKEGILRGMEEAAKMRREAEGQLKTYEDKLAGVEQDVARLRKEMREAATAESNRIIAEAKEQRARMERDAHISVEQEMKAVRERLAAEIVAGALRSAEVTLREKIGDADQQRFGDEYLSGFGSAAASLRGRA